MRAMLSWSFAFVLSCVPACARKGSPATLAADAGPSVRVDSLSHQFGKATEGDYLEHTFVIANDGPADLEIKQIQPNCPCVTAQLSQSRIPPAGKADLKVRFDTLDRTGDQDRKVTLTFGDASMKPIDLRVQAHVDPAIALQEDEDDEEEAEDTFVGADVTRELKVVGARAATAHVSIAEVTNPNITATLVDDPASGGKVVRALIRAPALGHFHAQIVLATDVPRKPKVVQNIDWSVRGNVTTDPVALHFETGGPSGNLQPAELVAVVKSRLEGLVVRSAKSQSPAFVVKLARGKDAGTYEVHVRPGDSKAVPSSMASSIELLTNDKVDPVVRLPILVSARPATSGGAASGQP